MSWLFASDDQNTGASASFLPMRIQDWFPLRLTGLIYTWGQIQGYVWNMLALNWAFLIAQLVKNPPAMQETLVWFLGQKRDRLLTPVLLGFPCGPAGKESACSAGDLGSVPGLGRSPGGGPGSPLQCSCLENPMDREAWCAAVLVFAKSWTWLSD